MKDQRRRRAIWADDLAFGDERARARFLLGPPRERVRIECGETYRPAEVWSWGRSRRRAAWSSSVRDPTLLRRLAADRIEAPPLHRGDGALPRAVGRARAVCSPKRPDRVMCNESKLIDRVTESTVCSIFEKDRPTDAAIDRFSRRPSRSPTAWPRRPKWSAF
ncbi:MAG: hypothetical protein R2862_11140 [Thermoanaerobaculia bacterium]